MRLVSFMVAFTVNSYQYQTIPGRKQSVRSCVLGHDKSLLLVTDYETTKRNAAWYCSCTTLIPTITNCLDAVFGNDNYNLI